ncbi:unnamed protein product [Parnassius mnemosyne]|uniref:DUF7869 domain-containing protein n=1 Tax=Parnassius mnemosyne TaxID=213953 RepID=A0AAV1L6J7_9NEOP
MFYCLDTRRELPQWERIPGVLKLLTSIEIEARKVTCNILRNKIYFDINIEMADKFKESRAKKLLQLINNQNIENKENYDNNSKENPVITPIIENSGNNEIINENYSSECLVENATFEGWNDTEPVAHCSYNPPENKPTHANSANESFSEDDDDSVKDPNYKSRSSSTSSSFSIGSSSSSSSSSRSPSVSSKKTPVSTDRPLVSYGKNQIEPPPIQQCAQTNEDEVAENNTSLIVEQRKENIKKGKKRIARVDDWLANKAKKLRNTGQAYVSQSKTKKIVAARAMKQPCRDKCKMQCSSKIDDNQRRKIFSKYWELGDITLQRNFINSCTKPIMPAIRFSGKQIPRGYNNAFYFIINNEQIRVCKKFFMATLDVNDRVIRTVFRKRELGFVEIDKRGKHGHHKKVDESIKESVRQHINSIPRIESHYIRKNSSREFIDGGKCIADLHADYKNNCLEQGVSAANYEMYAKIFNQEFNISFFIPKKDRCELCVSFENADESGKEKLSEKYWSHLDEKEWSRIEKENDKVKASTDYIVAVYDLQAVLQSPKGDVSIFYYKSKLNNLNFTISELGSDHTECYLWHEGEANRGADEIGSCVLKFIDKVMASYSGSGIEFVFFSDNCCGQQKNKFIFSMYTFALMKHSNIKSITHKYLITGHTQNEGDAAHSTIEKAIKKNLRSGPIYVPSQYAQIIRNARKKGNPYNVNEMCYKDFFSMKCLADDIGFNAKNLKTAEIKVLKMIQGEPTKVFIKHSYKDSDFQEIQITRKQLKAQDIQIKPAYRCKPKIKENKKKDLISLVNSNHIPNFYASFYNSL